MEKIRLFFLNHKWHILLAITTALCGFLHFFRLYEVPLGMHGDELSIVYDVFCLDRYGVDRNLISYPAWFVSHGDGTAPLIHYILLPLVKILSPATDMKVLLRALMGIFALITALLGFFYCNKKWPGRKAGYLFVVLFSVVPVFTVMFRVIVESHQMMLYSIGIIFLTVFCLYREETRWFAFLGILCGIGIYTYSLAIVLIPLYLLLMFFMGLRLKKITLPRFFALTIPFLLISFPAFFIQFLNILEEEPVILWGITFPIFPYYRIGQLDFLHIFNHFGSFVIRLFSFDGLGYSSIPQFGNWYYFSLPFFVIGFIRLGKEVVHSWKTRSPDVSLPAFIWILASCMIALLVDAGYTTTNTQLNFFFTPLLYVLVLGIMTTWDFLKERGRLRIAFAALLSAAYGISFLFFVHYYFTDYANENFVLMYETTEGVYEYYHSPEGESAGKRMTCYPMHDWLEGHMAFFYRYSNQLSPYEEFTVDENGHYRYGADYIEHYPDHILLDANYVVVRSDTASSEALESLGYALHVLKGTKLYVSPLEQYEETMNPSIDTFHIDGIYEDNGNILLHGWAFDSADQAPFTKLVCRVDDTEYPGEAVLRSDVAQALGISEDTACGFVFTLPSDLFFAKEITLYGVSPDGKQILLLQYTRR